MADLLLTTDPLVGVGDAALEAAAPPRYPVRLDAFVDEAQPDRNFGDRAKLKLNGGANECQAFAFVARPFERNATVLSATLSFNLASDWPGTTEVTARRVEEPWKEGRVTWDRRPEVDAANEATVEVEDGVAGQLVELDVALMLADVAAGSPWYGVRLQIDTAGDKKLWSAEAPDRDLRPELEVEWILAPLPPTELAPSGLQVISLASPLLTWRFKDPDSEAQASSQVQIAEDEDFLTIDYDSGKVANVESQWDLAATAYAGVPDGEVRYWRVKVWDEGDLASEWSDVEEFERRSKGALEIVNPAEAPDDFVEEMTPPLDWAFTGRVQDHAVATLYLLDELDVVKKRLERWRVTDETSVTVPRDTIRSGERYRFVVKVWDKFDRQAMPGDPDYVSADRDFTYERSGDPSPVTDLTAVAAERVDGRVEPKVTLTWERATQPDYFSVRVDGKEELQRIDPEDVWVEGTTYSMEWWRAVGGVEYEYEVEAVVNDGGKLKHSGSPGDENATATATVKVAGVWLVDDDPADPLAVCFIDRQQTDLAIGETAQTFELIGTRKPVRITDSLRGHEGSVAGVLNSTPERDDFLALKGRMTTVRLIQSTLNIPVELGAVGAAPRTAPGGRYDARAEVFQVDEWPMPVAGD